MQEVRELYVTAMLGRPKDPELGLQIERFDRVFSRALDIDLSNDGLLRICGTFLSYLRHRSENPEDASDEYEEKMQNYAHYLFPEGSNDPVVSELLDGRRIRLEEIRKLAEALERGPYPTA